MSGHSKWSQIKRQKGTADQKRGALFSKLTNAVILAARYGGDPNTNFALKMAIEKAKVENMPKENIERAIKRGTGELGGTQISESLYEAIGPNNIGIIIEVATDNKNRTTAEIKSILNKFGVKLASSGAVTYQFQKMGRLVVETEEQKREELELAIIDAGAEDFQEQDNSLVIYTKLNELANIKKYLEGQNITIKEVGLSWEPKNLIAINQEQLTKITTLLEMLENLDQVTAVYANFDL